MSEKVTYQIFVQIAFWKKKSVYVPDARSNRKELCIHGDDISWRTDGHDIQMSLFYTPSAKNEHKSLKKSMLSNFQSDVSQNAIDSFRLNLIQGSEYVNFYDITNTKKYFARISL